MTRMFAAILTTLLFATSGGAAEVTVISAGAVLHDVGHMIDDYSKSSGVKFKFTVGPTGFLRQTIASGAPADLIIASAPLMAELEATGKMAPGSRTDLGRIGLGVVIRDGAPVPDVSTPEAFKQLLINAKSIAYTDPKLGGPVRHLIKSRERHPRHIVKKASTQPAATTPPPRWRGPEISVTLIGEIGEARGALPRAAGRCNCGRSVPRSRAPAPRRTRRGRRRPSPALRDHDQAAGRQ